MIVPTAFPAILLAASKTSIVNTMFDDTFAGIHKLEFFDWALMVPYFLMLRLSPLRDDSPVLEA
jgi:hypothetical protein